MPQVDKSSSLKQLNRIGFKTGAKWLRLAAAGGRQQLPTPLSSSWLGQNDFFRPPYPLLFVNELNLGLKKLKIANHDIEGQEGMDLALTFRVQ